MFSFFKKYDIIRDMPNIRFGLIGLGYFGKHYVRLLQEIEGAELYSIANRSRGAFDQFSHILPKFVKQTENASALFGDSEIDAVIIATPPSTHFSLAKEALDSGKHVLVEKPMVVSVSEAYELKEIVEKSGRVFMVGHQYCYNDYIRVLKENIGILGDVRYIFAEQMLFGPLRADTGCLWDRATHELSIIDYLFQPGAIRHASGRSIEIMKNGCEDFASFQIEFESGLFASIACSWFAPVKMRRVSIAGTKGLAFFDDCAEDEKLKLFEFPYPEEELRSAHGSCVLDMKKGRTHIPRIAAGEPLKNELLHFIECIKSGEKPLTDIVHGVRITEYLDQISKSIMTRCEKMK